MEEAYDRKGKRVVPIATAVELCLSGSHDRHHDFDCADENCHAPVLISSFDVTNEREPYVASCRQKSCHDARCGCRGVNAATPGDCHVVGCEYYEPASGGVKGGPKVVKAVTMHLIAPEGLATSRTGAKSPRSAENTGARTIKFEKGNFTLFTLVDWLQYQSPATIARMTITLDKETGLLIDLFSRVADLDVKTPAAAEYRTDKRQVYFGYASLRVLAPESIRLQFRSHIRWDGVERPVSLFTSERQFRATQKRQRLQRMIDDIKASGSGQCFAFVLGRLRPDVKTPFINVELGRGLEEVLLFPQAAAGKWFDFERCYERIRGIV